MNSYQGQEFKKKREEFTINVRKANREQMIKKRRNIQQDTQQQKQVEKFIIIDQSFSSFITQALKQEYCLDDIEKLLQLINSSDILDKHRAVIGIKKLTYNITDKLIQYFEKSNLIKMLVDWSDQDQYLQIKLEALWIFTNLTSFSSEISQQLFDLNILPILNKALVHTNAYIMLQAIWIIGNLAADDVKYRDQINQQGCVIKIIKFLEEKRTDYQISTAIWTLTNLARGNPPPKYELVKFVVPPIAQVLKSNIIKSSSILSDSLWTLANLSEGIKVRTARVMETNVLPKVLTYLYSDNMTLAIPAIRIVGNFTAGTKEQTNQVLKNDFLTQSIALLDKPKWVFVKEVCWAISNITAGTNQQILHFLTRRDLIQKLLQIYPQQNSEVRMEIIWIFTNLQKSGIPDMIQKLYKVIEIIPKIGEQLKQKNQRLILDTLNCLYRVLSLSEKFQKDSEQEGNQLQDQFIKCGFGSILQDLQTHENTKIYNECTKILNRFFSVSETTMLDI